MFILSARKDGMARGHPTEREERGKDGRTHKWTNDTIGYESMYQERERGRSDRMTLSPNTPPMLKMKRPRSSTQSRRNETNKDERKQTKRDRENEQWSDQ